MQKKNKKIIKTITILVITIILLLLLIFAEDIIKLQSRNKLNIAESEDNTSFNTEPNIPKLSAGMIPVKRDGENWIITTQNDSDWYSYSNGKPAYIMLNDGYYKSELERGLLEDQLATKSVGATIGRPEDLGSIYIWIPRFEINNNSEEIKYKKDVDQAEEGFEIPEVFAYRQEETMPDFLLTGVWVAIDTDENIRTTIAEMNSEDGKYGFIKNTIVTQVTVSDINAMNEYVNNVNVSNENNNVGETIGRSQINDISNLNRAIIKIINQNNQDPIKASISFNKDTGIIEVKVTYSQYGISKILLEGTQELAFAKVDRIITADTTGIDLEDGEKTIIIIDNNGNEKDLTVKVISKIYATLYTDGTLAFGKSENPIPEKTISAKYGDISVGNTSYAPWYGTKASIKTVDFVNKVSPISTVWWFYWCTNLTTINNIENLNTSNVTDMSNMFYYCSGLTSLDVSNFDTSNVTDMGYMFYYCSGLTSLDVSNFDTSNVTDMSNMFCYCSGLTSLDVSNFDTSNVTDMNSMFCDCNDLTSLDVSNFDTSNVINMNYMFYNCGGLSSLDISNFDTSNVTIMNCMFAYCSGLTSIDVSNFNTSNVTDMRNMFSTCSSLNSLDLGNFDTSNVTNMSYMFYYDANLKEILVGANWTTENANTEHMFENCGTNTVTEI